jgi:hypothetical protein
MYVRFDHEQLHRYHKLYAHLYRSSTLESPVCVHSYEKRFQFIYIINIQYTYIIGTD